jgi:hypothetical protein
MEIKKGLYPNCSEWDQEIERDMDFGYVPISVSINPITEVIKQEAILVKEWD